jgi:hypothetical protein
MAITVTPIITGQELTSTYTYCYLYEPLLALMTESDTAAKKLFVDVVIIDSVTATKLDTLVEYAEYDLNPGVGVKVDLMKLIRQVHDANIFQFGKASEIDTAGAFSITSKRKYNFKVYSDISTVGITVKKYPVIGGREFLDFDTVVDSAQDLTEFTAYAVPSTLYNNRWLNVLQYESELVNPTLTNASPTITPTTSTGTEVPCGGVLYWKSRFGGWMWWGFDISTKTYSKGYEGNLAVDMFEDNSAGNFFVPVDYVKTMSSYSLQLKSLGVPNLALKALGASLNSSPAVYYTDNLGVSMELMRVSSVSAPISSLASGGDLSVTLNNISKTGMNTR